MFLSHINVSFSLSLLSVSLLSRLSFSLKSINISSGKGLKTTNSEHLLANYSGQTPDFSFSLQDRAANEVVTSPL